ncbi:MAG: hypothetical protein PHV59_03735 [Victivallales bacterium]|nr:hypothetical protein [Victivallales bacterium]
MEYVVELEASTVYDHVEYRIIIKNTRMIRIRVFVTHLLLKWAGKIFPGTMIIERHISDDAEDF